MKVKPCPICKIGIPRFVYYALPQSVLPSVWEETEDGLNPMITYKRVECSNCGASTIPMRIKCDQAAEDWNYINEDGSRSQVVQYIKEEVLEVDDSI